MLSELNSIWQRLVIHWHAVAVATIAMIPVLLEQLDGVDLTPLLSYILPAQYVPLVVALLPFVLVIMKPMIRLEDDTDA